MSNPTHVANPVRVQAQQIISASAKDGSPAVKGEPAYLAFSATTITRIDSALTARYAPVAGDYLVTQDDGYSYINPKDVFERKYTPLESSAQAELIHIATKMEVGKQLLIDAIAGRGVGGSYARIAEFERSGLARFTGNQHNESWEWNKPALAQLAGEQLLALYLEAE